MNRDLLTYFIVIMLTAIAITIGGLRLLSDEVKRGREIGQAHLQLQAEQIALLIQHSGREAADRRIASLHDRILVFVGKDVKVPDEGRCFGLGRFGHGENDIVRTCWAGPENLGKNRRRRFSLAGLALATSFLISLIFGAALLIRAAIRSRRQRESDRQRVAELSHRLRTPLTAATICAELIATGKLNGRKRDEACESLSENARLLGSRLEELIKFTRAREDA